MAKMTSEPIRVRSGPETARRRSADGASGTELVAVSFVASGSTIPGAATLAVLTSSPSALDARVPATVNVAAAPGARSTVVAIAPVPDAVLQVAPLDAAHAQTALSKAVGNTSETVTPVTLPGPLLVTTSEYPAASPGTATVVTTFVIARSATSDAAVVTDALSFAAFGSAGVPAWRAAVFIRAPGASTRTSIQRAAVCPAVSCPIVQRPVPAS